MFKLAVLPSIVLFFIIWKSDKIEKEPPGLLLKLFLCGVLTVISAILIGYAAEIPMKALFDEKSLFYIFIDNFFMVALVEEGGKYFVLKKITWNHPAFDYTFDAVVYSVTASLGFATFENIMYLLDGEMSTAIARAILSVPGHVMYAIFMGYYYGLAKSASRQGDEAGVKANLRKALIVPTILHGFYDFSLSTDYNILYLLFVVFEIALVTVSVKKVRKLSREDTAI